MPLTKAVGSALLMLIPVVGQLAFGKCDFWRGKKKKKKRRLNVCGFVLEDSALLCNMSTLLVIM